MSGPRAGCLTRLRRGVRLACQLAKGLLLVGFVFPRIRPLQRDAIVRQWCRDTLEILSVRLTVHGDIPPAKVSSVLFVANHVSWLDILAITACRRVRFVAKSEVRRWPLVGWLAARTGTMFFRRASSREMARVAKRMAALLRRGHCVAFFPEGTTTDGAGVKPFHSGLFESAIQAEALVWPTTIQYRREDGSPDLEIGFLGDQSLVPSVVDLLRRPTTHVRLSFAAPIESAAGDRRVLASRSQATIERCLCGRLSVSGSSHQPAQTPDRSAIPATSILDPVPPKS